MTVVYIYTDELHIIHSKYGIARGSFPGKRVFFGGYIAKEKWGLEMFWG